MGQVTHIPAEPMTAETALRWIVDVDEHTRPGDGVRIMQALQIVAGIDLTIIRTSLEQRMNAPFDLASVRAETT